MTTTALTYRLFLAVTLAPDVQAAAAAWSRELEQKLTFRKWVHPHDLHITLQFLGPTQLDQVDALQEAVQSAASRAAEASFTLTLGTLGTFGRPQRPSILWAGIGGDGFQLLTQLHAQICDATASLGFEPENRAFHPHLTLAREYNSEVPLDTGLLSRLKPPTDENGKPLSWRVDNVTLYRSLLGQKPMYDPLASFPIGPQT
ncbi:2'-5' RNA ligase [Paenibacillus phyllosphaerae]|uniref:RNA 2',3'-cyclic phosphodiesterase n=1 Tax=Paenibacillus phyllosphaerae TaxID=274593 RepID=A0A7W5B125_9BACL|nr:RNA 2',3'-cyclic phosphodiesterase [Paenibacillus phyllosphaerae]MBB3112307.1 2'-5' RNA ligase [Paenibacillus phyllosphaerae]